MSEDIENAIISLRYAKQLLAETHAVYEVSLIDDAIDGLKRRVAAEKEDQI